MIKNRVREIVIGMSIVMIISFMGFYFEGNAIRLEGGITGMSAYEPYKEEVSNDYVAISGREFTANVGGKVFYYMFTDDNKWFESKDEAEWEERIDMGSSMWSGLYYLKSYDAKIYFNDREIKDISEFAKGKILK